MSRVNILRRYFNEGYCGYYQEKTNPYKTGSKAYLEWDKGYWIAEEEEEKNDKNTQETS